MLDAPLPVENDGGTVKVLRERGRTQAEMGEALTIDTLVGSVDAEVVATGPSGKGPGRGAILRHGSHTLWGFNGGIDRMTPAGAALFVNVVHFAAAQVGKPVLEKRLNGTRDGLFSSLDFARRNPGYIRTMRRLYLPEVLGEADPDEVEAWLTMHRPYLRTNGRRFELDELALSMGIPNHRVAFLERCIENLRRRRDRDRSRAALLRYTGLEFARGDAAAWAKWLRESRDYLHFSDCEGFRFKVDEEAKAKGIPTVKFRGWSSEEIDYRPK